MTKIFGTDGVRGVANSELTPELAMSIGRTAAALLTARAELRATFVVGRDTRLSGTMLEAALVAGITSVGADVMLLGIVPTPGVAHIVREANAAGGFMVSASHNPIEDNGIKIFGPDGFKLDDDVEHRIERELNEPGPRPTHEHIGSAYSARERVDEYLAFLLSAGTSLTGLTVVVDAANGAAYQIGPRALERLGARVVAIHADDDGARINVACGATDLRSLVERVLSERAATGERVVGVAFDGDADRVLFVDEEGVALTGDHVMYLLACDAQQRGELTPAAIVGTVMSNIGLERALTDCGIALVRAPVGDRYVLEQMRAGGYILGGEQSGHIIDLRRSTTGDGVLTAISLLSIASRSPSLHDLAHALRVSPQVLVNVRTAKKAVLDATDVRAAIDRVTLELGASGRVLVRPSGTEPLIRVMMEGDDRAHIDALASELAAIIRNAAQ